ncbi:glutamyl aminopeptidase-like [Macrobrachium rosenbergii]|uniref:glutamyl aminopeptidase-like n=1 Tax=Macrobrachium rosenbergii TaxID=79674 RepID=UPI0034D794E5
MPENARKKLRASSDAAPWEDDFRLPSSVRPSHYDLYLHPDLGSKTFAGSLTITLDSLESRDYFLLHTKWLRIYDTKISRVESGRSQEVEIIEEFEYEPNEFWVVKVPLQEAGVFQISMKFSGSLTKAILGFYHSEYTDVSGVKRGLATTKFEPTYARRAFPCFDEPSFKSTYSVTVVRPSERYIALSNMPVKVEKKDAPSPDLTEVTFEKSVPMVTYLVCFIVCDFTYKEVLMKSGMPFRVYAPEGRVKYTQFALETGVSILQMYEGMFDLPFPLPKSDMAAIPDYSSGATEHWGIITYRETNIFFNENRSSAANKQRVASVVAHELAHQWFGNLVTLDWWNDLWLNEGFASYVEFKGVDHVFPDWQMDAQFQCKTLPSVMDIDASLSSHPIVQTVGNNDQINAMFDAISYQKGSSVLRMLEDFMGEASFQKGINAFLKKFAYDNAVTKDLWTELTLAWDGQEKRSVGDIMDTWTRQMGYPVVSVSQSGSDSFSLKQSRFLQDPQATFDPSETDYSYKWDVPISYITSSSKDAQRSWLYRDMDVLVLKTDSPVSWIKVNLSQKGFYRVNYEPAMWRQLEQLCTNKVLGPSERASLLSDALALADAALLDYDVALDMTRTLASDREYVPWDTAAGHLVVLTKLLIGTGASEAFNKYMSNLAGSVYKELGWEDSGEHLKKLLRIDIVSVACASGDGDCLKEAARLLKSWIKDAEFPLPLGTRRQIYRWGITEGSQECWDVMWQRSLEEQNATELDNLYYGMANVQNAETLQKYIELAKDEKNVRCQNFLNVLQYISSNPMGCDLVWDWVRENWPWLVARYTLNDRYLGQMVPNISRYFTTEEKLKEMKEFFVKYPEGGAGELCRKQALETVEFNINWLERNAQTILQWLKSQ